MEPISRRNLLKSAWTAHAATFAARGQSVEFRKPLPPEAIEHTGLRIHSVVALKDSTLLAPNGRRSADGGRSWSEASPLGPGIEGTGLIRLQSGNLALTDSRNGRGFIRISRDEGKSWSQPVAAFPPMLRGPNFFGTGDEMIQLKSGRLVWSCSIDFNPRFSEFMPADIQARGIWRGMRRAVESHQHLPEIYMAFVAYSNDEGQTWKLAEGLGGSPQALFGWFDEDGIPNGNAGHQSFGETSLAETSDGRILMFGRSEVGRILYTCSRDGGESWDVVLPSELANSGSPPRLRRIPKTGDLLCVWNQVSHEEIRRGYRRGRLSAAISRDGGWSWTNFKTLELSEGLDDVARVAPEKPIRMVRARRFVGQLPDRFAYFHYPNVNFVEDRVFLSYLRGSPAQGVAEKNLGEQRDVLRIYPLDYFYR